MKRSVLVALVIAAVFAPTARADVGRCIGAYQGFLKGSKALADVQVNCLSSAKSGAKVASSLLGAAYFRLGHRNEAEPWLRRAAHQGDITAAFLLADIYARRRFRDRAAKWAYRGSSRLQELREANGSRPNPFLKRLERNVREMVSVDLAALIAEGEQLARSSHIPGNPFLGKWRIGPNENCDSFYTTISLTEAAFHSGARRSSYEDVRFDLVKERATLVDGAGTITLRVVDQNTLAVTTASDGYNGSNGGNGVIATRCD